MFDRYRSQLQRHTIRAREEERKRIARELHDQIIQQLLVIRSRVATIAAHPAEVDPQGLDQLQHDVAQMLDSARQICTDLRPPALGQLGLCGVIKAWLHQFQQHNAFELRFDVQYEAQPALPEEVSIGLFRVLQEALINIQKHAAASLVVVKVGLYHDLVVLEIRDNGIGFNVPENSDELSYRQCFGLIGMRERIELMEGTLEIQSAPGHGTCVAVQVPVGLPLRHMAERYMPDEPFYAFMDC